VVKAYTNSIGGMPRDPRIMMFFLPFLSASIPSGIEKTMNETLFAPKMIPM